MVTPEEFLPQNHRIYLPESLIFNTWENVEPFVQDLMKREPSTKEELWKWILDFSELCAAIDEQRAWLFIRMTCDTLNVKIAAEFEQFVSGIVPQFMINNDLLLRKLALLPAFELLDKEEDVVLIRMIKNAIEIYRIENVSIFSEIQNESREFDTIAASLEIDLAGEKATIAKATRLLEEKDRNVRQEIWTKINNCRLTEQAKLDNLYSKLISLRTTTAHNAGFTSFADFSFPLMGRFDYSREDCYSFHEAVEKVITPVYEKLLKERKQKLNVETLFPCDLMVDLEGGKPLNPFSSVKELTEKTRIALSGLHPQLGELLSRMDKMGRLDLDSRLGKAPGGYSYPLNETHVPFIFMNAAGSQGDLTTMVHEMGHSAQAWLMKDLRLFTHFQLPSEIAELASMSLEFLSQDYWNLFYDDQNELKRARKEHLIRPFNLLPWIASIDKFQHWAYDHPAHSVEMRSREWKNIYSRFHGDILQWPDENAIGSLWQKQGHLYDSPFYYIEYGMALLGAVAIWRNYKKDPKTAMENYFTALSLGYSRPIPEVYRAAGIKFDFSENYIKELANFLLDELDQLDS